MKKELKHSCCHIVQALPRSPLRALSRREKVPIPLHTRPVETLQSFQENLVPFVDDDEKEPSEMSLRGGGSDGISTGHRRFLFALTYFAYVVVYFSRKVKTHTIQPLLHS